MRDHTEENVVVGLLHLIPWMGQRFILPRIRTSSEGVLAFLAPQLLSQSRHMECDFLWKPVNHVVN